MNVLRKLRKPRFALVYVLAVWLFVTARTTEPALRLGILAVFLGEAIRLWANGYVGHVKVNRIEPAREGVKIGRLITAGPYAFVRHPLYLGTFLLGAGACLIVRNGWLSLAALGFFLTVYRRKMKEEEERILHEWGEVYLRYHRSVPRWIPSGRRFAFPEGSWSWRGIAASKEWKTVAWVIVLIIALYLREEALEEGSLWSLTGWLKHPVLLGLGLALMTGDALAELARRHILKNG